MSQYGALRIGLIWQRLSGFIDEAAQVFLRTSFSSVVRDNWDMAVGLLDRRGRQIVQSSKSVPSFVGTMPHTLACMLERLPAERLEPGDVLICNDAWFGTGHLNDITMFKPVFRGSELVAFIGSVFHSVDIGGAPSVEARDAFEEGLTIPVCRIVVRGEEDPLVIGFLEANLRAPRDTLGDIRAQFAAYDQAERRLLALLDAEGIDDLEALVDDILARSEHSMRAAVEALPDGSYRDELWVDGFDAPLKIVCTVTVDGSDLRIDYEGTSPQVPRPINSVLNYTTAYTNYAVKCLLDAGTPNNDGTFRPVRVSAPAGSLLNPNRPAPVWARHLSGHYVPPAVFGALAPILPDRVIADCGSPLWSAYFQGRHADGRPFIKMFFMNGGHGARQGHHGPACLSFPSNVATVSIERFEASVPLIVTEKALLPDSGGSGRYRGGPGQRLSFEVTGGHPVTMTIRHERVKFPPRGMLGGGPGARGRDLINDRVIPAKGRYALAPGDVVTFETPGGGGFGAEADGGADR
ncbi:MAG: hydantoinase B/oxoprolinase family protein [Burkholderiales bacterium]|nr:MAG: hydantoinase B/oxoprolinase family protein [Burkholderiales bacterium]